MSCGSVLQKSHSANADVELVITAFQKAYENETPLMGWWFNYIAADDGPPDFSDIFYLSQQFCRFLSLYANLKT